MATADLTVLALGRAEVGSKSASVDSRDQPAARRAQLSRRLHQGARRSPGTLDAVLATGVLDPCERMLRIAHRGAQLVVVLP
jgi:hypothetical protein